MNHGTKRGSSRRKGDEFQDLTALRLILELYIAHAEFRVFLEYEKAEAIDDIVIFTGKSIRAVQAKYAVDPLAVYVPDDFVESSSRTFFGRYSEGWRLMRSRHPNEKLDIELVSNRGRDSTLEPVIGGNGHFLPEFVEGRIRGNTKDFRDKLQSACAFQGGDAEAGFRAFLTAFRFQLGQRSLPDLGTHIQAELLDHRLGISDRKVFFELKELVERHAIELHEPITSDHIDAIVLRAHGRLLLPQIFPLDRAHFVSLSKFTADLEVAIHEADGAYVVVTGLPGSGKSTCLSDFFENLEKSPQFAVCRYYCFVRPNDSSARLRVQAEALRTNLLTEFHSQFGDVLDRRHDYSEANFINVLTALGQYVSTRGRKLVILLDGLDHAERDPLVQESVLQALPTAIPPGIVFVIGTQELGNWQPLALREGRENHHVQMPLFSREETSMYFAERHKIVLDELTLDRIHAKCEGLPLYLWYVAQWLIEHDRDPAALETMPEAVGGDIRNYYERLWGNLERDGMSQARHLCEVLATLRFPVAEEELAGFQDAVPLVQVPEALRAISHLLRHVDNAISIFHDSFRVFVDGKLDATTRRQIAQAITHRLKSERGSARWFVHVFRYAIEAGDDEYVLQEIGRPFVDFAMQRCRPADDVFEAIQAAGTAASHLKDLVALARLGSLNYRTRERLKNQFDYSILARALLNLGRVDDVLSFCCQPHEQRWTVDTNVAMRVMIWCADTGKIELGRRLFNIFRQTHSQRQWSERWPIEQLARVLGIYSQRPSGALFFLSRFSFQPDILERPEAFAPGFAPQLEAFLEAYFRHRPDGSWKRLKRVNRLFPNNVIRYLLLRLVAQHQPKQELAIELDEYLVKYPGQNLEIARFAALAGFPPARVRELAGPLVLPPRQATDTERQVSREEHLDRFCRTAIVLGYEDDPAIINHVAAHIGSTRAMWSGFLRFQLQAGVCLGRDYAGKQFDYFADAVAALKALASAGQEDEPQEMEVLRACRPLLPDILFQLTRLVAERCPEKMDEWRDELLGLQKSEMWTSHWGISETIVDYTFELRIWERLAGIPEMRTRLLPILQACAKTYTDAASLKAGARSEHFIWLAAIAARCGWRTGAETWIEKGIACSLTYGYHKDITIDYLVDVLEVLNRHERKNGLARCAAVLEMVKWMHNVTDGRSTKHFNQSVFDVVLDTDREAALALIRYFREHVGRWKMQDCLEKYVCSTTTGDIEVLWTLKDVFVPDFQEWGRHPKQATKVARYLRDLAAKLQPGSETEWNRRFVDFVRTHFDPGWWPDDVWAVVQASESRTRVKARESYSSGDDLYTKGYKLDGQERSRGEIEQRLAESLDSFCRSFEQLRAENDHFYDYKLIGPAFSVHVRRATSLEQVRRLWGLAKAAKDLLHPESLAEVAHRLYDFDQHEDGFQCLLLAYEQSPRFSYDPSKAQPYLHELCQRDNARVIDYLADRAASALNIDYGGFESPRMIARYFLARGDVLNLRTVCEDYLTHCQELFAHLPPRHLYDWLRDYQRQGRDESLEVVSFLVDLLAEPEIEQSQRLVRVLASLAKVRPELVCRECCQRFLQPNPVLRRRLGVIIETLGFVCPKFLALHVEGIIPLISEPHFQQRILLIRTCQQIATVVQLPQQVVAAIENAKREYSPLIARPPRSVIQTEPSIEFVEFVRKGTLFEFQDRLRGVGELLRIDLGIVLASIERALRSQGWTIEGAEDQRKEDWHGWAFDKRAVAIVTTFDSQMWEQLQFFIHETLINGQYDLQTIDSLWGVIHLCDPEFVAELPRPKPADVPALAVGDPRVWLDECLKPVSLDVKSLATSGWTALYEAGFLSQTEDSHPKYVSHFDTRPLLVTPELSNRPQEWPAPKRWVEDFHETHPEENLALKEARDRVHRAFGARLDVATAFLPIIVLHHNSDVFAGFRRPASLHPAWIAKRHLEFRGFDLYVNGEQVTCFMQWQEGCEDETYSRALLSAGMSLLVRNDWLNGFLKEIGRALVIRTHEDRKHFDSRWERNPTAGRSRERFKILVAA